jgi:YD repeat-containing protein
VQNGIETRHSYNSRNQLIRTEGVDGTKDYLYDKRGNLTQITENGQLKQQFTFDAKNMMTHAFTANKGNAEYAYNGFRNRVKKLENLQIADSATPDPTRELRYTLDMTLPYDNLLMTEGSQNQNFIWGNSLLSATGESDNQNFHYLQDHLGSPIRLM